MGMYDNIICEMPLPGIVPAFIGKDFCFQTKDLDCCSDTFVIRDNELFRKTHDGDPVDRAEHYSGEIEFYQSNIRGSGPALYTRNGEDAESVCFTAQFIDGKMIEGSLKQTEYEVRPAFPMSKSDPYKSELPDSFPIEVGKTVYILAGGREVGYIADVQSVDEKTEERKRQFCIKSEQHGLEIEHFWSLNRTVFENEEVAFSEKTKRTQQWKKQADAFEAYKAEWHKKRNHQHETPV